MSRILDVLFCSEIRFTPNRKLEEQYEAALDDVLCAEKAIKTKLPPELWPLVEAYLDRVRKYHGLDAQLEFERGFSLGAEIMLEVLSRELETPEQK